MRKKLLLLLVCSMTVVWCFAQDSGTCGENLKWTFDRGTGTLTISGTGAMADYAQTGSGPWSYSFYVDLLKQVIIEEGVTSIGNYAFSEHGNGQENICSYFTVSIPNSVKNIGEGAFLGCRGIISVNIPKNVANIGKEAFGWCPDLTSIEVDSDNSLYSSENGVLFDKEKITLICYPAGKSEESYIIPNGVTKIEDFAFYGYHGLTAVSIPVSVTSIGYLAFCGVGDLKVVEVSWENPISIELVSFGCVSLSELTLIVPQGTSEAYRAADVWKDFGTIKEKDISGTCGDDLTWTFNYTTGTLTISGSGDIPDYGSYEEAPWYSYQNSITDVVIESGVTSIGDHAFDNYFDLKSITIPNTVTRIGFGALGSCRGLTSVNIPNSVVSIGTSAFWGCSGLSSITIPNSVTSIGDWAFGFCSVLTSITIPESVTFIDNGTFYGCSNLSSIIIPNSVTSIGSGAFAYCSGLTSVTVSWEEPFDISDLSLFDGVDLSAVQLIVPYRTKALYEAAPVWQDFGTIVEKANIDITPGEPAGADGEGSFNLALEIPINTLFTGSFYIQLPEGFTLNTEKTCLSDDLASSLDWSITQEEGNKWLITISRPEESSMRSKTDVAYTQIMKIVYNVEESVTNGSYESVITDLNFEFEDGTVVVENEISGAIQVDHDYTKIKEVSSISEIYILDNQLYVNTPQQETIYLYSVYGQLEYSCTKPEGSIIIPLSQNNHQILIVKGSSGWVRKMVK